MGKTKTDSLGPKAHWLFGLIGKFQDQISYINFLFDCVKEYGDVVRLEYGLLGNLRMGRLNSAAYLLNNPIDIQHVLITNYKNYPKALDVISFPPPVKKVFGQGLVFSNDPLHLKQRRIMQPFFNHQQIAAYADMMVEKTQKICESWKEDIEIDLSFEISQLTMGIATKAFFNMELSNQSSEFSEAVRVGQRCLAESFFSTLSLLPFSLYLPARRNREIHRVVALIEGNILNAIKARREGRDMGVDLLSALLHAHDEDASTMSDQQLRDEIITLFLAGHETTANALSFTFYLLSQHPDVEARLLEELHSVLGDKPPSFDSVPSLVYAERVFAEALRLYPPAWILQPRVAKDSDILPSGVTIPAGDIVIMLPYITHRNPKFFPDPDRFDPERFTKGAYEAGGACESRPPFAYFPFSGGSRGCIGERFAQMEGMLILATIAKQFKMTLLPNKPVIPNPLFTLCPKEGVWMRMQRRAP